MPQSPPVGIVKVIFDQMRRFHVTQMEMAARTGMQQPTLSHYFTGRHQPKAEVIDRMLKALEVEVRLVPVPLED